MNERHTNRLGHAFASLLGQTFAWQARIASASRKGIVSWQ